MAASYAPVLSKMSFSRPAVFADSLGGGSPHSVVPLVAMLATTTTAILLSIFCRQVREIRFLVLVITTHVYFMM